MTPERGSRTRPGATRTALLALTIAAALAGLAALAATAGPTQFGQPRWDVLGGAAPGGQDDGARPREAPEPSDVGEVASLPGWVLPAGALLTAMLVALVVRRLLARRPADRAASGSGSARPPPPGPPEPGLTPVVRSARTHAQQVDRTPGEPGDDVVRAWCALEDAAARSGAPRSADQTPSEFTARLLTARGGDDRAVADLLRLYHRARFSTTPLPPGSGVVAADALARIAGTLAASPGPSGMPRAATSRAAGAGRG